MSKSYKVFTQKLAAQLMLKGFVLKGIEKSLKNNGYNVFIFKDSEELRKAISEIKASS